MNCERCGVDVGTDGVLTVVLERTKNGTIEALPVRECRGCAAQQAQEEESHVSE